MTPSVPYGWQAPGERIEIPSSRSGQFNVLGFMRHDGKQLTAYVFEGAVDTETVIACMDAFSKKLKKPTTVVIDNAPIHHSAAFQKMIPEWEEKNLYLWFIPLLLSRTEPQRDSLEENQVLVDAHGRLHLMGET